MKKLLTGLGLVLAAGIALYLGARHWVWTRALSAIESATGAQAQAQEIQVDLWARKVSLRGLSLVSANPDSYWESAITEQASSRILWSQRSPGIIPMEISLEGCLVTLRASSATQLLKQQFQPVEISSQKNFHANEPSPSERPHSKLQLTAITASRVDLQEGSTLLAEGLNANARRGMSGWQGELAANRVGSLPLTEVRVTFSSENPATRLTEISCNLKNGHVSGSGIVSEQTGAALNLKIDSLPLTSVAPQWCPIAGQISTNLAYQGDPLHWQFGTFSGDFTLNNATIQLGGASQILNLLGGSTAPGDATPPNSVTGSLKLSGQSWELTNLSLTQPELFSITGNLSCHQGTRIKADLNLGISKALGGKAIAPETAAQDRFAWTGFSLETTPDQLWQCVLASLIKSATAAGTPQSSEPAKASLQEKAKNTANTLLHLLSR